MTTQRRPSVLQWRKSERSSADGQCVEVAALERGFGIRDSKDPEGAPVTLSLEAWKVLNETIKTGGRAL